MMIVPHVVEQHCDDAMFLGSNRLSIVQGPSTNLRRLGSHDRRLAANLEGLRLAGEKAWMLCEAALESPSQANIFPLTVRALETRDRERLGRIISVAQSVPETSAGLLLALGWVEPAHLQGAVAALLSGDSFSRALGIAACAMHRVNPGAAFTRLLEDADSNVRARAFRAVGELGREDMLSACLAVVQADKQPDVLFWAAWSAVLLGNRGAALEVLLSHGFGPAPHRERAFRLAIQAMTTNAAHAQLQRLAPDMTHGRWVIQGSGLTGDPAYVPWLIKQMDNQKLSRLAGQAFTLITGLDLGAAALDCPAPEGLEAGPTDDPDDPAVDGDPDEDLSWPHGQKIRAWWEVNGMRFQPGRRYFMGAPVDRAHCLHVSKQGYQQQRRLAAHYLCLLTPGTSLFNTSAPAWRQQRLLADM